jgi:DNA-directed RNA polymerase II subunit RPB2
MEEETIWKIINSHFIDNPQTLVRHHIDSYNDFYKRDIFNIFKEKNPVRISSQLNERTGQFRNECNIYFGGKNGDKLYFGKPVIYDDKRSHFMFPNEARLRNMTYGMTIHYDVEIEFITHLEPGEAPLIMKKSGGDLTEEEFGGENYKKGGAPDLMDGGDAEDEMVGGAPKPTKEKKTKKKGETELLQELTTSEAANIREMTEQSLSEGNIQKYMITLEKVYLGKFPIMLQSDFCILKGLPKEVRHTMGECRNDFGGYFIIDGKEKTVVAQEKFADNMLYIREATDDKYTYSAEIRSVSENASKPIRTVSVKIVAPSTTFSNMNLVVSLPNVRKPVPLFILFRALGIISDKEIISYCLLDIEKYESMVDLFIPSVHDAAIISTQHEALRYIALLTKGKTVSNALEIITDYFLPHIGEMNYVTKAYALGHMVFRLLQVHLGLERPTDRDNFKYKRVELVGSLLYDLFREYWNIQQKQIHLGFEKALYYSKGGYDDNLYDLIMENYREVFRERSLETGFRKAYKGNWGAQTHTKRIGVVQDLNRLSFNSALNHLRKTNLPLDSSVKLVGPRVLHNSQWGYIDPIDTPDGGSIGLHKHLAISTYITRGSSREPVVAWLREAWAMKFIEEYSPKVLSQMTKVIINGLWIGSVNEPIECVRKFRLFRRNALLPIYASITFQISANSIFIYTDAGRLCRPIFYKDEETGKMSYENKDALKSLETGAFKWENLVSGFNEKRSTVRYDMTEMKIYSLPELYDGVNSETNPAKLDRFIKNKAILDYIDTSESENAMIAMSSDNIGQDDSKYTHCEIHESLIFGMMCNLINYPENNPATRNSFSCGQSKQACSLYHTNYQVRMDKTALVLNYGQIPLVKSRYLEHIQNEENPYGENAIVAVMCLTGYNVEDAMLINEGAIQRGLFRTSYFSTYEAHEENTKTGDNIVEKRFMNIESDPLVTGLKDGCDYSKLDEFGIIKEGTVVDEKTALIGLITTASKPVGTTLQAVHVDGSKMPKKGQLGTVDKTFITEGEEGTRIAKVRLLEQRIPSIGDKMASRAGQKGTIGLVIPERDMPFTKDGIRPDLIINPHAIPSRMTIGQFVECITGKASAILGGFGDCTAFLNKGSKAGVYGELLIQHGFHSSGNELLYNGMTGEQLESEIFMGPTYYMRLKHMVKDKINYRARGPRSALTKQPVGGRANDGGLRVGEMERDSIISHGATNFLQESMLDRGDKTYIAICNKTGIMSIYNPSRNVFLSPVADGPLKFTGSFEGDDLRVEQMSKFGRDFSVICVPYAMKLLIQELQTINIQMRIITEDNLDQIENMSYSTNIEDLVGVKDISPKILIDKIKASLQENNKGPVLFTPEDVHTKTPSIDYPTDVSPAYQPSELGEIPEGITQDSPAYDPNSPAYDPNSPAYDPNSPAYNADYSPEDGPPKEYSPHSPEGPPPGMGGGGKKDALNVGDQVFLRGESDGYAHRPWQISKKGDKFITIIALDSRGLSMDKQIRVVTDKDIFKSDGVIMAPEFQDFGLNSMNFQQPMINPALSNPPVQITFAPKIFNHGNDNSVELEQGPKQESMFSDPMTNMSSNPSPLASILGQINDSSPPLIKIKAEDKKESEASLDLSKPFSITKKG